MKKYCYDCDHSECGFGEQFFYCTKKDIDFLEKYGDVHDAVANSMACESYSSREYPDGYTGEEEY